MLTTNATQSLESEQSETQSNNNTSTYYIESDEIMISQTVNGQSKAASYSLGLNTSALTPFEAPLTQISSDSASSSQVGTPRPDYNADSFNGEVIEQKDIIEQRQSQQLLTQQKTNSNYFSENQVQLLDQKALNELLSVNVYQLAQNTQRMSPQKQGNRKNSDDDVYVEETLVFLFDPAAYQSALQGETQSNRRSGDINAKTVDRQLQTVDNLRKYFVLEAHNLDDDYEDEDEKKFMRWMMNGADADAEIDKILETFQATGLLASSIALNGDFLENDIRLSENIREIIDEIKMVQRPNTNKAAILDKKRFLQRYMEKAEQLDVSLTVEHLLPALYEIFKQDDGASDKEYAKIIFQQMGKLIDFLGASEITVGYNGIRDHIMPFLNDFFQTDKIEETLKQEILVDVINLLVKVSRLMTNEDRTEKILPIILDCVRDDSEEEKRILGLELVDNLAELMGKENCQNFLMYEIVSLQDDPIYRVRKETINRMINISKVLGKEIFISILFPVFKKLANDQIWGVRRSAVEQLPNISNLCPVEIKNGVLIDMFKKFAADSSKWVKMAAFQFLGPFIATYEGIEPNPVLIDYYISMCEQNKSMAADNEVPFHCAYNFPAVLLTLGIKNWPKLKPVYESLVKDSRIKVRRTLSFSLHEIAKILGPELTEKELIPVLTHFMRDNDDVKEGVVENLPKFLLVLTPEQRESFVDQLRPTAPDEKSWRKRITTAQQIRKFSKIFSAQTVHKYYSPLFFQLCQDDVAEVRIEAAKAAKNLALKFQEMEDVFSEFIIKVLELKSANKYFLRQTFIIVCSSLMQVPAQSIFKQHLMSSLCELQRDRVINVRLALAEMLSKHYNSNTNGGLVQSEREMRLMVKHLKYDSSYVSEQLADVEVSMQDGDEAQLAIINQAPPPFLEISKQAEDTSVQIDPQNFFEETQAQVAADSSATQGEGNDLTEESKIQEAQQKNDDVQSKVLVSKDNRQSEQMIDQQQKEVSEIQIQNNSSPLIEGHDDINSSIQDNKEEEKKEQEQTQSININEAQNTQQTEYHQDAQSEQMVNAQTDEEVALNEDRNNEAYSQGVEETSDDLNLEQKQESTLEDIQENLQNQK